MLVSYIDYRALEIEIICDLNKDEISKKIIWYNASVNLGACFCYDVMDPFQRLDRSVPFRSALDSCSSGAEKNNGATALPVLHRIGSVPCMPRIRSVHAHVLTRAVARIRCVRIWREQQRLFWLHYIDWWHVFLFIENFFDFSQFLGCPPRILYGFMWRLFWFLSFSKASK